MAQGILPFKYENEKKSTGMTALADLPVYLDLAQIRGLSKSIARHLKVRKGGQEWAEVCYVPNAIGHSKKDPVYRCLAKREVLNEQQTLPGMDIQIKLPFPTMDIDNRRYKVFGMVTNMDWEGEKLIHWLHERCGKSEEAPAVVKDDLAGGKLPSGDFGKNAAWWPACALHADRWVMILALNLNAIVSKNSRSAMIP